MLREKWIHNLTTAAQLRSPRLALLYGGNSIPRPQRCEWSGYSKVTLPDCPLRLVPLLKQPAVKISSSIEQHSEAALNLGSSRLAHASAPCGELRLDLVDQRVGKFCLTQLGKVVKNGGLPRLLALKVLGAAILKIKRPCLVHATEEHERTGAVRVEPDLIGRKPDGLIGHFECLGKITEQDKPVS